MTLEKEKLVALMAAAMVGPKIPAESEGTWEDRVEDAIARAGWILQHVLKRDI